MILVDTSIWIDHFRRGVDELGAMLRDARVLTHPWVVGELALGQLSKRAEILTLMRHLPTSAIASDAEVLELIDIRHLSGRGIGYVDAQLLASTLITFGSTLWTTDKHLARAAAGLGVAHPAET